MLQAALLACVLAGEARAWDRHAALTAAALRELARAELDAPVRGEPLTDYLAAAGQGSEADFVLRHKLKPGTAFPLRLGEDGPAGVPLRRVVEGYADEPDHGMDQDLFDAYPELWRPEYKYMGGDQGAQSRVFRHVHWPNGFLKEPVPPGKLPVPDLTALGEAHERARLFHELSREAFGKGRPYWGARFLSWSLHYLQDLTQPYHAVQLPTLRFLRFKPGGGLDVETTGRVVAYHHLAADALPSRVLAGELGSGAGAALGVVAGTTTAASFPGPRAYCVEAAKESAAEAADLADAALDFLPAPSDDDLKDPLGRVYSPGFWEALRRLQQARPQEARELLDRLAPRLESAGRRTRTWVAEALSAIPPKPAARRPRLSPKLDGLLRRADEAWRRHLGGARALP